MTKKQIIGIENKLDYVSRRIAILENRLEAKENRGDDIESINKTKRSLDKVYAKMDGILDVVILLGYKVDWEITNTYDIPHLVKRI